MRGIGAHAFLASESSRGSGNETERIDPEHMVKMVGIPAAPVRGELGSQRHAARPSQAYKIPTTYTLMKPQCPACIMHCMCKEAQL